MLSVTTCSGLSRQSRDSVGNTDLLPGKAGFTKTTLDFRFYCLILVSSVLLFSNAHAQAGAWTKKADIPKGGGSASVVNNKIYVLGGSTTAPSYTDLAYNEVYDPSTNTWQDKKAMPTPRGFLSTAVVRDTVYAIGGGYPTPKNVVEAYDPVANAWITKANMLSPRLGAQAAVVDGIVYNIGGNYSQSNCEAYDPNTNSWTRKKDIPMSGGVLSVTAYDGKVYAFGGGYYGAYSTVYAYDPNSDIWTKKKDMPTPRFAFQTYLVDGKIYAMGGVQSSGGTSIATVEVYDPVNDSWESKADMPNNLAWFAGSVVSGKIYVIGGTADWGLTMSSSVWEYDPAYHTDIAAGTVSGTWRLANSPYHINGEITIPNDSTLTIQPGVEVVFMGHYKFNVQGRLLAVGTQKDTIRFTAEDTGTGWHGIRFVGTPNTNDTSKIVYCVLRNGNANTGSGSDRCGGALLIDGFDKVFVSHCLFHSNMNNGQISTTVGGAVIFVQSASPIISDNTFSNNTGTTDCAIMSSYSNVVISHNVFSNNRGPHGPIVCAYYTPIISGNTISNNVTTRAGGGVFTMTSTAIITNNIIFRNQCVGGEGEGGGIKSWIDDRPVIINNTIAYNNATRGGGVCCNQNADPLLINNIIWGNTANDGNQVNCMEGASDPDFLFCDIQGGKDGFGGAGSGVYYTGLYENNVDFDPLFKDTAAADFRLSDSSPCIGAGIDSVEIAGVWYHVPPFCIMGNPRPSPAGTNPDIGACESLLGSSGLAYAHDVRLARHGRDTIGITARVENPLAHLLKVAGTLSNGGGVLIDSLSLKDDGLHGDSVAGDGLWGYQYVPKKDDTIRVTLRTDDLTSGTSRTLPDAATILFTRGPLITMDTRSVDLGRISLTTSRFDTTFMVKNAGYASDSLTVSLDLVSIPDTAVSVFPTMFTLSPGDSQKVTFRLRPNVLSPSYYAAQVVVESKFSFGQTKFQKNYLFQVVISSISDLVGLPTVFMLDQNYPNPFNPTTTIRYGLPQRSAVQLIVFNTLGQQVALLQNEEQEAGYHQVQFEGTGLSTGVYFYQLKAGTFTETKKLLLVR